MDGIYYFCEYSRTDHKYHVHMTILDEYSMTGDYLLFDSAEECAEHYRKEGKEVII